MARYNMPRRAMPQPEYDQEEEPEPNPEGPPASGERPLISYRGAMWAYAALGAICLLTLHGDALYIALLIIGALAVKTWLAEAKSRIE